MSLPIKQNELATGIAGASILLVEDDELNALLRISVIVDDCFSLIVDGVSTPSWTRGDARKRGV